MINWLTGTLLASSMLMLVVLALREPVRRQFGAPAAYALWLLPALRMLMPPITRTVERTIAAVPLTDRGAISLTPSIPMAAPHLSLIERLGGWPTILIAVWAVGAILFLAVGFTRYRRQRRAALDGSVQLARLGSIRLVRSRAVRGPIAFGILDKVIAVPDDFDQRFDDAQRRLALDHELAHHRSGDLIANHIGFVLLGLQWFNPIAWMSHAAFRFDQEAACDCRILDKAGPNDRVDYGRTIAKAASGKALLFASALDHNKTLQRRLKSMLTNPTPRRRLAGKAMIIGALGLALPLTATRAIDYVDVVAPTPPRPAVLASPAPRTPVALLAPMPVLGPIAPPSPIAGATPMAAVAPLATVAPLPALAPSAPMAPTPVVAPVAPVPPSRHGRIMIDGQQKQWSDLSPEERARIRGTFDQARRSLAMNRFSQVKMHDRMQAAMAEVRASQSNMHRDMATAREKFARAARDMRRNSIEFRRFGPDPKALDAQIRASLKSVDAIDVDAITRRALASVDAAHMERSLQAADEAMKRAQGEIDAADRGDN